MKCILDGYFGPEQLGSKVRNGEVWKQSKQTSAFTHCRR